MSLANIVLEQVRPDRWEGWVEAGEVYVKRVHIEADTGNKILREAMRVYAELMAPPDGAAEVRRIISMAEEEIPRLRPLTAAEFLKLRLPPTVVDVPYVSVDAELFSCTMGNWTGEPTGYAYQWKQDGALNIGENSNEYMAQVDDIGHSISCVVTATNAGGSTVAPPSNVIVFEMPVGDDVEADDGLRPLHTRTRRQGHRGRIG